MATVEPKPPEKFSFRRQAAMPLGSGSDFVFDRYAARAFLNPTTIQLHEATKREPRKPGPTITFWN